MFMWHLFSFPFQLSPGLSSRSPPFATSMFLAFSSVQFPDICSLYLIYT